MKTLMVLTVLSAFSLSAAAASACDGMRDHEKGGDTSAKNESGKSGKAKKAKPDRNGSDESGTSKS